MSGRAAASRRALLGVKDRMGLGPRDFSWKVRWRMRNDRNPRLVELQDKLGAKRHAAAHGVASADVFCTGTAVEDIPFESLPDRCVVKATHGAGWNIMHDHGRWLEFPTGRSLRGDQGRTRELSLDECKERCRTWLRSTYSRQQWAYSQIPPAIIVEERLRPKAGSDLVDVRCFVFDGVVKAVDYDSPEFTDSHILMVDADWHVFDLPGHHETPPDPVPPMPDNWSTFMAIAAELGAGMDFVRVDLFDTDKGPVLAEMTMYPEGGWPGRPTGSASFNRWLGDQWVLPARSR